MSEDQGDITIATPGEGRKPGTVPHQLIARAIYSDESLSKAFAAEITEAVDERLRRREARRNWFIGLLASVLLGAGLSAGRLYVDSVVDQRLSSDAQTRALEGRVVAEVATQLGKAIGDIRAKIEDDAVYQRFAYTALSLDVRKTSFSKDEKDAVMSQLQTISASRDLRSRAEFRSLLEKVIDRLDSSGVLDTDLDHLVELFGPEADATRGIVNTVVNMYGRRIVGSALPPARWSTLEQERFDRFERLARTHNIPEEALPWRLLIEFKRNDEKRGVVQERLLKGSKFLPMADRAVFHLKLVRVTDPDHWMKTAQAEEIARTDVKFLEAYAPEMHRLLDERALLVQMVHTMEPELAPALFALMPQSARDGMQAEPALVEKLPSAPETDAAQRESAE